MAAFDAALPPIPVVDLFCGCGGFSTGAQAAGREVVLAVDNNKAALKCHKANHPACKHKRMKLGPGCDLRLQRLIAECVPAGSAWHLHGSPPCQPFSAMSNIGEQNGRSTRRKVGMRMVRWFVSLVKLLKPTTWSLEEVGHPLVREFLEAQSVTFATFDFAAYGVPQTRKRILAGSPHLVERLRSNVALRVTAPVAPLDVLKPPPNAALIRASGGKNVPKFYRRLDVPTWCLLTTAKPYYLDAAANRIRPLSCSELLVLQTFPASYVMPGVLEADRVRMIGNAVPPLIAKKLLS